MSFSVSETARLTGVSVRTLHYYDEIGLLSPSMISETGYRYYDDSALERLQQILFYRELDFALKDIAEIMNASGYQKEDALRKQRELLQLKRKRLDKLIHLLDAKMKGENTMSFTEFDMSEIENAKAKYAKEVNERWGGTDAYRQSQRRTSSYSKEDWARIREEADDITRRFAEKVGEDPASPEVQELVAQWQNHITKYYYDCTDEILAGLGQMYVADERFTKNIDKFGEGTAKLKSRAIEVYCSK